MSHVPSFQFRRNAYDTSVFVFLYNRVDTSFSSSFSPVSRQPDSQARLVPTGWQVNLIDGAGASSRYCSNPTQPTLEGFSTWYTVRLAVRCLVLPLSALYYLPPLSSFSAGGLRRGFREKVGQ